MVSCIKEVPHGADSLDLLGLEGLVSLQLLVSGDDHGGGVVCVLLCGCQGIYQDYVTLKNRKGFFQLFYWYCVSLT